jgi:lipoprotein-releasing system permease protein
MFDLFVAFRFLKEGRTQTVLILVGIILGIAVQVFLNALIVGLQASLISRTVGAAPHIVGAMPDQEPIPILPRDDARPVAARVVTNEGNIKPIHGRESRR